MTSEEVTAVFEPTGPGAGTITVRPIPRDLTNEECAKLRTTLGNIHRIKSINVRPGMTKVVCDAQIAQLTGRKLEQDGGILAQKVKNIVVHFLEKRMAEASMK